MSKRTGGKSKAGAGKDAEAGAAANDVTTSNLKEQQGDTGYLAEARAALADIRHIWGAESVQKLEVAGKDETLAILITCVEAIKPTPAPTP